MQTDSFETVHFNTYKILYVHLLRICPTVCIFFHSTLKAKEKDFYEKVTMVCRCKFLDEYKKKSYGKMF